MPRDPPVHDSSGVIKTCDFAHFWPFSWAIVHGFRVPGGFRCPMTLRYTTLAASSKIMISHISVRFCGLQSTIFGSREDFDAP